MHIRCCSGSDVDLLLSEKLVASQIELSGPDLARSSLRALHITLFWNAQDDLRKSRKPPESTASTDDIGHNDDVSSQRPFMMTLSILCPIPCSLQRTRRRRLEVYAAHLAVQLDLERIYGRQDSQNLPDMHHQFALSRCTEDPSTVEYPLYCYCNVCYTLDARNQAGKTAPTLQAYPCHVNRDPSDPL